MSAQSVFIYNRVLLKLSGEHLAGEQSYGIDAGVLQLLATEIKSIKDIGIELAITVGGGNIFRGMQASTEGMNRAQADYMGMLATVINSLAIQDALEKAGVTTTVMSAIQMPEVCETYTHRRAWSHLEKGRVIVFAAGTGNPYFTTDTTAALRACEIGAEAVLKATKVDGIYDSDPKTNPDAIFYERISYMDVLTQSLGVMDATAVSLCMDNNMPLIVFNLGVRGNMQRVLCGETVGTVVY